MRTGEAGAAHTGPRPPQQAVLGHRGLLHAVRTSYPPAPSAAWVHADVLLSEVARHADPCCGLHFRQLEGQVTSLQNITTQTRSNLWGSSGCWNVLCLPWMTVLWLGALSKRDQTCDVTLA